MAILLMNPRGLKKIAGNNLLQEDNVCTEDEGKPSQMRNILLKFHLIRYDNVNYQY